MKRRGCFHLGLTLNVALLLVATGIAVAEGPGQLLPLAVGGPPDCPDHLGSRIYRSAISGRGDTTVFIEGTSERDGGGCRERAVLRVAQGDRIRSFEFSGAPKDSFFQMVDFSPDGTSLLIVMKHSPDGVYQRRDISIARMSLASGEMHWENAWDMFAWKDCDAMVEPQGYMEDGRVVILARRTVVGTSSGRPNCINETGLYVVETSTNKTTRVPDSTKVVRYGKEVEPEFQACKTDPDIVDACFKVHGRLSVYNGGPSLRIWRIGTDRMLGVSTEILPESLASPMGWDVDVYGDFEVCPFTTQKPGEMQMVCVESAEHVVTKKR